MSGVTRELHENSYLVTHTVGPHQHGIRLDHFLKERYSRRSRTQLQEAIESGAISLRREQGLHLIVGRLKSSSVLVPGDEVVVLSERKPEPEVDFNYKILHEDEALFVIDKPANLPVHPAGRFFFNTLLVHLRTHGPGRDPRAPLAAGREYFLVHRIDRETSGVLVLTKTRESAATLVRQFAERRTQKRYLAIVRGVTQQEFNVDAPMARSPHSQIELKMAIVPESEGGQSAQTGFTRLETAGDFSLLECRPRTGRQHQIRVHLDHVGHPIVGDKLYGMPEEDAMRFIDRRWLTPEHEARLLLPRHALHATSICFKHPLTGLKVTYESPLPKTLADFLEQQRSRNSAPQTTT